MGTTTDDDYDQDATRMIPADRFGQPVTEIPVATYGTNTVVGNTFGSGNTGPLKQALDTKIGDAVALLQQRLDSSRKAAQSVWEDRQRLQVLADQKQTEYELWTAVCNDYAQAIQELGGTPGV